MTNTETFFLGVAAMLAVVGIKKLVGYFIAQCDEAASDYLKLSSRIHELEFDGGRTSRAMDERFDEFRAFIKEARETFETIGGVHTQQHNEIQAIEQDLTLLAENFNLTFTQTQGERKLATLKGCTATELTH